jgi:hypothetical protein
VNPGPGSLGRTDETGAFTLTVVGEGIPGAYIGNHRVEISAYAPEKADANSDRRQVARNLVPPQYNTRTTLTFEVRPGGTGQANFDLRSR